MSEFCTVKGCDNSAESGESLCGDCGYLAECYYAERHAGF